MNRLFKGFWLAAAVALVCCAPLAHADTFTLTGANPNNNSDGGVYVSPYQASINGGSPVLVICDDFSDEVYVGETWNVQSPWSVDQYTAGDGLFTGQTDYEEAAWLVLQLVGFTDAANQAAISYAIWTIFDPSAINSYQVIGSPVHTPNQWITLAAAAVAGGYTGAGVTVWTPTDKTQTTPNGSVTTCPAGANNCGRPQEFLTVSTPDASAWSALAMSFLGLGALVVFFRRRISLSAGQ